MGNDYMSHPATVKSLAEELKIACDDYFAKRINNDRIKEIILWYANTQPEKLFSNDSINSTIAKIIGKKRVRLINDLIVASRRA